MSLETEDKDIRWKQRFKHYQDAFEQFSDNINTLRSRELSNMEKQGLIKSFEFTHELAWNVIKDFFVYQGDTSIMGSRDAFRKAFEKGLIEDGHSWMAMIISRNNTVHTYNKSTAEGIIKQLDEDYFDLFVSFEKRMSQLASK